MGSEGRIHLRNALIHIQFLFKWHSLWKKNRYSTIHNGDEKILCPINFDVGFN